MKKIKSLRNLSFDNLYQSFSEAFKDYEVQIDKHSFYAMLQRRGFSSELSFGLFESSKLVAFVCNGVGVYEGAKMAYDIGTGTLESYRGFGYASRIFTSSLPFLKDAGVTYYLLEVLQHNTKAVNLYKQLGFEIRRSFYYYMTKKDELILPEVLLFNYEIKPITHLNEENMSLFFDFSPSWQNSFAAIKREIETFKLFGAFFHDTLVGYCIIEPFTGDISQISVDPLHRRKGIATQLLRIALAHNNAREVKIINVDVENDTLVHFLEALSVPYSGRQYEMIKKLRY